MTYWTRVTWVVTGDTSINMTSQISNYLNVKFPDTNSIAVIPNRLLIFPALYSVTLTVTNRFVQTTSNLVRFETSISGSDPIQPQVRIFGGELQSYR